MKRVREIRKFHVAVMQRRLKSVMLVMHVQSCCFANINLQRCAGSGSGHYGQSYIKYYLDFYAVLVAVVVG